jgi:hypothetical protein
VRRQNVIPIVRSSMDVVIDTTSVDEGHLPDKIVGRAQMRAVLERRQEGLPNTFRVVFVLRSVEELNVAVSVASSICTLLVTAEPTGGFLALHNCITSGQYEVYCIAPRNAYTDPKYPFDERNAGDDLN